MNKPQSLRHALNKAVPYVRNNPDKLHLFVDNGSLVATGASSMSWEYRYTLNVVIEDFSGDQNLLMAPVLLWLRDNQPDAINNPALREKLFTFEVDILRNDVCDISLNLQLTERVLVSLNLQLTERVLVSTNGSVSSVEAVAEPDEPEEMWTVKRG
ncbi:phage tail protein [Salmonella enterica subsp. enterica]|nr:phage tail protein [Salmonella enterica subsp. enterica serovar Lexington]